MKVFKEPIEYQDPLLCIKIWKLVNEGLEYPIEWIWHYHKEVEVLTVEQGILDVHIPDKVYRLKAGDSCIIGSSQLHFGRKIGTERLVYMVLHIDLHAYFNPAIQMYYRQFTEIDQPLDRLNYIIEENEHARREIADILKELHDEMQGKKSGFEIATSMLVIKILLTLFRNDDRRTLDQESSMDVPLLKEVISYINSHIGEKIELKHVCKLANMSYSYFSKYFKKMMGISFTDYVNRRKIQEAERLLITKNMRVTEIAETIGIENMAHFYELFKRYTGCKPKEYIAKLRVDSNPPFEQAQE
ncbi:helix-turn-helix domain-containing protein [Paenibacillus segetis]|uniref:AraC family transcriptional regulator n=1 Tax=Paenibacillus segetis TaxID=1325360 RepID=A0ABQ1YKK5_9BACL|nr:AraC family transcriptional regulator [Paenibacillus segetis]GGH27539.1 AraC family transcriptional regulator [Paenibacillus segetis]